MSPGEAYKLIRDQFPEELRGEKVDEAFITLYDVVEADIRRREREMSSHFQPHASEQFRSDREPDALVDSDPDGAYDYEGDRYVPEFDQERDFAEERFNADLMREE